MLELSVYKLKFGKFTNSQNARLLVKMAFFTHSFIFNLFVSSLTRIVIFLIHNCILKSCEGSNSNQIFQKVGISKTCDFTYFDTSSNR